MYLVVLEAGLKQARHTFSNNCHPNSCPQKQTRLSFDLKIKLSALQSSKNRKADGPGPWRHADNPRFTTNPCPAVVRSLRLAKPINWHRVQVGNISMCVRSMYYICTLYEYLCCSFTRLFAREMRCGTTRECAAQVQPKESRLQRDECTNFCIRSDSYGRRRY